MKRDRLLWTGVVCIALAFGCFTAMDGFEDYSTPQDFLNYVGYLLVTLSVFLFLKAYRSSSR